MTRYVKKNTVIPAKAGIQSTRHGKRLKDWIPTFVGMTKIKESA